MRKSFLLACALLAPPAAHADRITRMDQTELCVYTAQLQVAAYYYFEQGKPREEVSIKWHGDETRNEIDFVNKTVAEAYAWLTSWKDSSNAPLPVQSFGDMVVPGVHEQKRFVIAAAVALFGFAGTATAQKDAAEKAKEGGIEHWIEYYKAEQRKPVAPLPQPASQPAGQATPGPSTQRKSN